VRKVLFSQNRELVILDANARLFASLVIMTERNRASQSRKSLGCTELELVRHEDSIYRRA
jgi:hypothetical protein